VLALRLAGAPNVGGLLPLFSGRESEPLLPVTSMPLFSFPFFFMTVSKFINDYGYKSFKSEGVPSPKDMSNQ
jgi:hypothetical protein